MPRRRHSSKKSPRVLGGAIKRYWREQTISREGGGLDAACRGLQELTIVVKRCRS